RDRWRGPAEPTRARRRIEGLSRPCVRRRSLPGNVVAPEKTETRSSRLEAATLDGLPKTVPIITALLEIVFSGRIVPPCEVAGRRSYSRGCEARCAVSFAEQRHPGAGSTPRG